MGDQPRTRPRPAVLPDVRTPAIHPPRTTDAAEERSMTRRMSPGMQIFNIGRSLSRNNRFDTEAFDISAHLDRSLHYDENLKNIQRITGQSPRNRGMEQYRQGNEERAREHARRQNKNRQVGFSNEALDRLLHAQAPGKRRSASGRRYYEYRQNRSDRPPGRI